MATLSPIEALWVFTMGMGIVFVNTLLVNAILDNRERAKRGLDGDFAIIAHGKIRSMILVGVALKCFAAVGVVAALLPERAASIAPGTRDAGIARFSQWFSPLMLLIGGGLVVVMMALEYWDYRRLLYGDRGGRHTEDIHAVHGAEPNLGQRHRDGGGD